MDLTTVTAEQLLRKHPERVKWEARWSDYLLAYRGGFEFLVAAGQFVDRFSSETDNIARAPFPLDQQDQRRRFLWQLEGEPTVKYDRRWERAAYVNYLGAIIDFHRHWLYSQPPQFRPAEQADLPAWFSDFSADATGSGVPLIDLGRETFLDLLLFQRTGWLAGKYDSVAQRDDDDRVVLTPYSAREILDWQCSPNGELEWITLMKERLVRQFPDDRKRVRIVTYLDRTTWHSWEVQESSEPARTAAEISDLGGKDHGLGVVPFIMREIPPGLWIADKLFAPCISIFNRSAMLEYGEHIGCYPQPFMRTHEGNGAQSRILGEGIILDLKAGSKERDQEEYGWISPDISPLQHIADRLRQDRDELYRTVHQMSLAVDSQAVGAIARSGASKIEDRRATEIILAGYGAYEIRAFVQTLNLLSLIYKDERTWVCEGFDNFQTSTLDEELQIAALAQAFNIKSPTFNAELQKWVATGRIMPHLDEETKEDIADEIDEAIEEEAAAPTVQPLQAVQAAATGDIAAPNTSDAEPKETTVADKTAPDGDADKAA